jgi:hypothetical protein
VNEEVMIRVGPQRPPPKKRIIWLVFMTNFILRIKEQETLLTLHKHDDDDDDDDEFISFTK